MPREVAGGRADNHHGGGFVTGVDGGVVDDLSDSDGRAAAEEPCSADGWDTSSVGEIGIVYRKSLTQLVLPGSGRLLVVRCGWVSNEMQILER